MTKGELIELAQVGMGIHSPNQPEYIVCEALIKALAQPEHEWVRGECVKCGQSMERPEQEPVGYWMGEFNDGGAARLYEVPQESMFSRTYRNIPLYTTPPQRKPLTDLQIGQILDDPNIAEAHQGHWRVLPFAYARAIEAAHGIKGEA